MPVTLPPGRARLSTNPLATGSPSCAKTMGIVPVAALAARVTGALAETDDVDLETHQLSRERGEAIEFSFCISPVNDEVLSLDVPKVTQTPPECLDASRNSGRGSTEESYPGHLCRLLRVGGHAKCKEHGAECNAKDFLTHCQLLRRNWSIGVLE